MGYGENFKARLPQDLKDQWDSMCEARNIPQASAFRELVAWVVSLEAEHQAVLFRQIPGRSDLATMLLRRMAAKRRR